MAKLPEQDIENARSDILAVVERYVELESAGPKEYRALCPFHSEKSPSFTVTPGLGRFHCFGCGAAGTSIDFVMQYESVDFRTAVQIINKTVDAPEHTAPRERREIPREEPEEWTPLALVPDGVPPPMDIINRKIGGRWTRLTPARRWEYRDAVGALIGYVYRFNKPPLADGTSGGKEIVPQVWAVNQITGELQWRWLSFGKPRPIYGLDLLAYNPKAQVLVVEGEKACDAARALFLAAGVPLTKLVVVAWPGGGKAVPHVDWSPLYRRKVALWPDYDQKPYKERHPKAGQLMPAHEQPGFVAMRDIHDIILDHCEAVKYIAPPAGVVDGWDLADELPEGFNLLAHMKTAQLAADVFAVQPEQPAGEPAPMLPWEGESDFPPDVAARETGAPAAAKPSKSTTRPSRDARAEEFDKREDPGLGQNNYFRVLGYDHGSYFIFQYEKCQIMVYSKGDFSEAGLIELAPLDWWETYFELPKGGIDKKSAMNWIVRKANSRGVYDMERIRGRGAWTDKGRNIFHHGDYLTVDGEYQAITEVQSHYVYEMSKALPDISDIALTKEEGRDLLDLASEFSWAMPASAAMLAGWVALAPIGGALTWRPHVWITGGAGSGKTTVLNKFVNFLSNGIRLYAQGASSEAGIRQRLKSDALPVLFDESESNTEREGMRIQNVLAMVRQASTESQAETLKGTAGGDAMAFHIRSMFCLASIQVGIKYQADIERMTVLSLRSARDEPGAQETWERIKEALHITNRDEQLPGRLVRRSIDLLPITLKNIDVFAKAAAIKFGSQRDGDQYGTLLAGAWSLVDDGVATEEAAAAMINSFDWSEHRENNEVDEGERALASLMGALVRIPGAEVSVNELIRRAHGLEVDGLTMQSPSAEAVLQRHGMRTDGKRLILSNTSHELRRLVEGTPFEADLRGVLLRVKGADRYDNRSIKFNGIASKAISLPLDDLLTDYIATTPEHSAAGLENF